jgi:predicted HTH domain antitoxin
MTTLTLQVPDATLISLKEEPFNFAKEIKVLAAVKLFELGKLSSGRAAELADMSRIEFLTSLGKYNVGPFEHMSAEDLHRDFLNA